MGHLLERCAPSTDTRRGHGLYHRQGPVLAMVAVCTPWAGPASRTSSLSARSTPTASSRPCTCGRGRQGPADRRRRDAPPADDALAVAHRGEGPRDPRHPAVAACRAADAGDLGHGRRDALPAGGGAVRDEGVRGTTSSGSRATRTGSSVAPSDCWPSGPFPSVEDAEWEKHPDRRERRWIARLDASPEEAPSTEVGYSATSLTGGQTSTAAPRGVLRHAAALPRALNPAQPPGRYPIPESR